MKRSCLALLLVLAMLLSGCGSQAQGSTPPASGGSDPAPTQPTMPSITPSTPETPSASAVSPVMPDPSTLFSDRDLENDYEEKGSVVIQLKSSTAECSSNAVRISGSTVTILDEGTYILSGTLEDGMIVVDSEKTDKTQLVLNGVTIHSESSAPIYVRQSDKVFITTAEGTVNTLSNGGTFTAIDENNIDAAIFSKEDITLNGSGTLVVTSPVGHGIVSKDSLTITGGSYDINCASHAIAGKDDVCIADGAFTLVSGKDGIHAENNDDASVGFVFIQDGAYTITAQGDGISTSACLQIDGGTFSITTGGGSANAEKKTSDAWGGFMGGGRQPGGAAGGRPSGGKGGFMGGFSGGDTNTGTADTSSDSTSLKGIKAAAALAITGGTFTIDSADDAVHSNASLMVSGGTFAIASGDDAFHAEDTLTITDGTIHISESYEGLEGLHIVVSGGDITLTASDDGLNAAGGTDSSGFTGGRDGMFGPGMGGSSSNGSITISGGTLHITASGDGIDANGTLDITGGYTTVCGPTQGDTATLDYDSRATISGGTFIGTGASGMAQSFSTSPQGVFAVSVGNQSAGTEITLTDKNGNVVISHTPELNFAVVILSSPQIITGETYTITVGTASGSFAAN